MDGTDPYRQQPQMTMATTLIPHQTTSIPINPQEFVGLQQSAIQPTIQQASLSAHHHQGKLLKSYWPERERASNVLYGGIQSSPSDPLPHPSLFPFYHVNASRTYFV